MLKLVAWHISSFTFFFLPLTSCLLIFLGCSCLILTNENNDQNRCDYIYSFYKQYTVFGILTSLSIYLCLSTHSFRVFFGGPSVWSWSMTSVSAAARSKRRTATSANTAASRSACQWECPTTVSPTRQGRSGQCFKLSSSHTHAWFLLLVNTHY